MHSNEKKLVEDYILQRLTEGRGEPGDKGDSPNRYKYVPADGLERDSYKEPLLVPNLRNALARINTAGTRHAAPLPIGTEEINKAVNELMMTGTGIEGSKRVLNFYKFGIPVKFEKERVVHYIRLFDFDDIGNNEFIVTRQVNYDGRERIRTDLMLYVNGIPLVNIECKNPVSLSETWYNAYRQIKDYERAVPELYKYVQIGVAAETQARYFPIVPWQDEVKTSEWRRGDSVNCPTEGDPAGRPYDSIDSIIEMLSPATILDIIKHFLFYRIERGNATKVITRYMQYRAANKIVARVEDNLKGREEKNRGLIWHWQGSGKTLTMIFGVHKLYFSPLLENPTVFFIVDRIELEEQLYTEFNALDIVRPEIIGSVWELKEVLKYDDYRGKRGIFIVIIHKFRPEELGDLQKEIKNVGATRRVATIMDRKNVIAFVDESHRTQYGTLAAQMKAMIKNAFFFALTGTPISKKGRDTYLEFSYPPGELYLDRYFIMDSIKDGFTVKIVYQPRLEKDVHLRKDMLEAFLETELEELPEEIRGDVEEQVKKRLNAIKLFLENPQRIKVIAADIASHFKENVDGRFKAMVVAASRKACELYRQELNKHLPPEYSTVVMSFGREGEPLLQEAVAETRAQYGARPIEDIRKEAIEKFKEEEFPKIVIVTDMLLTGFDSPILQVMYLDKPLREHRLLQAVARTNRPYKDLKDAGLVIDYIGILKEFKKALEMYGEEDIRGALFSLDSVREEFVLLIKETLDILKPVGASRRFAPTDYDREILLKAVELLTSDEEKEKEFVEKYKNLRKTFEFLGPDEIKVGASDNTGAYGNTPLQDYKWLSAVYTYYMKVVVQKPLYEGYVRKYYDKTVRFVQRATEIEKLEKDLPTIAFDREYLEKLEERVKSREEKAANILFTLNRLVLVERHRNPIYESLVEKVERLLKLWKEKTKDYQHIYTEGANILHDITALSDRQRSLGFSDLEYALLLTLEKNVWAWRRHAHTDTVPLHEDVKTLFKHLEKHMFFGWFNQITVKREVEREIRRFVRGIKARHNLSLEEMNALHEKLMEGVKNYGTA